MDSLLDELIAESWAVFCPAMAVMVRLVQMHANAQDVRGGIRPWSTVVGQINLMLTLINAEVAWFLFQHGRLSELA